MTWHAQPHIDWVLTEGRYMPDINAMFQALGTRLHEGGAPLQRVRFAMRTVHPLVTAISTIWDADPDNIVAVQTAHGMEQRSGYIGSPLATIRTTQEPLRLRLDGPLDTDAHRVLHEMKAQGIVEYFGLPITFAHAPMGGVVAYGTAHPKGFTDHDIAQMTRLADALAPVIESYAQHYKATAIAKSYLGPRTGQRVLDGQITRGDIETIEAAILFSDIRGWTALNATEPPDQVLDIANRYFEVMSDAIDNNGGEILKFLGDGVLALFPSDGSPDGKVEACRQAISAAHAALGIAALAELQVPFGTGIHYGALLYGNVGARERLDFTVLGQSVNIASRVEAFCGRLNEPVLISDPVARIAGLPTRRVSTEVLKGLDTPMDLHAPTAM
ncbi:adenylate/guanylate cyclase domain-containing protein [uncultured Tateyamaria sp.]|uniref:adenylate/guanylate cyclase domain-containing protein n=1 Tax=uncultured Tateyamaria sp. TaxID=455651 RepID=UPI0026253FAE|nr:adenylate/guanylate cyclase domain-containing protein [uncultured Tateyamaria sp.]